MEKLLNKYQNGNTSVRLYSDGTKIRTTNDDEFKPEFPENIDVKVTQLCYENCAFCLTGDSMISTPDGAIPIEQITVNAPVLCYDVTSNKVVPSFVYNKYKREVTEELICIETENGKMLKLTGNHKLYTQRGWVEANDITLDDELLIV